MPDSTTTAEPGNDNPDPNGVTTTTVTIGVLAAALGIDEDAVLHRIAGILDKRGLPPELLDDRPRDPFTGDVS
jgi:hypothetical protein